MTTWGWVFIGLAAIAVVVAAAWTVATQRRTRRLRQGFGPEYDRTLETAESKREAEAELAMRRERREQLDIRPLSPAARERYLESWRSVQAQFVDDPEGAVLTADGLIRSVMAERGYPVEEFDQRAADISVDHPRVVENYRQGHRLASMDGDRSTEDLRQAMRHYRALFEELVEWDGGDETVADERTARRERVVR